MSHFINEVDIDHLLKGENIPLSNPKQLNFPDPLLALTKANGVTDKDLTFFDLEKQLNMTASQIPNQFTQLHNIAVPTPTQMASPQTLSMSNPQSVRMHTHMVSQSQAQHQNPSQYNPTLDQRKNQNNDQGQNSKKHSTSTSQLYSDSRSQSRERNRTTNSNGSYNSSPESNFPYTPVDSLESCTTDSNMENDANLLKSSDLLGNDNQPMAHEFSLSNNVAAHNNPHNQTLNNNTSQEFHNNDNTNHVNPISHDISLNDNMHSHRFLLDDVLDSEIDKMISGEMDLPIGNIQSQFSPVVAYNEHQHVQVHEHEHIFMPVDTKPPNTRCIIASPLSIRSNTPIMTTKNVSVKAEISPPKQQFTAHQNKVPFHTQNVPGTKLNNTNNNNNNNNNNLHKKKQRILDKRITKPTQTSKHNTKTHNSLKKDHLNVENLEKGKLLKCFKTLRNNYLSLCESYNDVVDRLNGSEKERKMLAAKTVNSETEKEDWKIEKDRILLEREDMKAMLDALLHEVTILRRKDRERTKS